MLGAGVRRQRRVNYGTERPSGEAVETPQSVTALISREWSLFSALQLFWREDEAYSENPQSVTAIISRG